MENGPWSTVLPVADPLSGLMYAEAHSGSNINHVNGSIGEIRGHAIAVEEGHISIQSPGKVTAPGVDYVTYDPESRDIVLWDSKYRSEGGSYPAHVSDAQIKRWTNDLENTISSLPDSDLKREVMSAFREGRIKGEISRWPRWLGVFMFNLKGRTPLSSALGSRVEPDDFVSSQLYRIADELYLFLSESGLIKKSIGTDEPVVVGVLWAPSVSSALRVVEDNIEGDDFAIGEIPQGFFPFGRPVDYKGFRDGMSCRGSGLIEAASYRMSDGAFVYRYIQGGGYKVYFRGSAHDSTEAPFAVLKRIQ